jgi:hypothetical protein
MTFDLFERAIKCGCFWARTTESHFWCRQIFHFAGGAIVGLAVAFIPGVYGMVAKVAAGSALFGIIASKEILEDRVSQRRFKTFIDVTSWIVGYLAVVVW